jgi:cellulose synthase A
MCLLLQHVGTPTNHHALVAHPNTGEIMRYNPCMLPFQLVLLYFPCATAISYTVSLFLVRTRPINPNRDLALYGYGSVAWKNRVEWKRKQQHKMQKVSSDGEGSDLNDFDSDRDIPR